MFWHSVGVTMSIMRPMAAHSVSMGARLPFEGGFPNCDFGIGRKAAQNARGKPITARIRVSSRHTSQPEADAALEAAKVDR